MPTLATYEGLAQKYKIIVLYYSKFRLVATVWNKYRYLGY